MRNFVHLKWWILMSCQWLPWLEARQNPPNGNEAVTPVWLPINLERVEKLKEERENQSATKLIRCLWGGLRRLHLHRRGIFLNISNCVADRNKMLL